MTMLAPPPIQGIEQFRNLCGDMLAITVKLHRDPVSVTGGPFEAGLHGAADAKIIRQVDDQRLAGGLGRFVCLIMRAIVNHEDIRIKLKCLEICNDSTDVLRFVICRYNDQDLGFLLRNFRRYVVKLAAQVGQSQLLNHFLVLVRQASNDHRDMDQDQGDKPGDKKQDNGRLVSDTEQVAQTIDGKAINRQVKKNHGRGEPENRILFLDLPIFDQQENRGKNRQAEEYGYELNSVYQEKSLH